MSHRDKQGRPLRPSAIAVRVDVVARELVIFVRQGDQIFEGRLPPEAAHEFFHQYSDAFAHLLDLTDAPAFAETPPPGIFDHGGPYEAALKKRMTN